MADDRPRQSPQSGGGSRMAQSKPDRGEDKESESLSPGGCTKGNPTA